jgi:hypothetical protein
MGNDQDLAGKRHPHQSAAPAPDAELSEQWEPVLGLIQHEADARSDEYEPVRVEGSVRPAVPGFATWRTMVLGTNQVWRRLLPRDERREQAQILAVDADIVIAESEEMASNANNQVAGVPQPIGFYLSKGLLLPVRNQDAVWVANTSSSSANRVSVLIERHAS